MSFFVHCSRNASLILEAGLFNAMRWMDDIHGGWDFPKDIFRYRKVVYCGIAKNLNRLHMLFDSANLLMCARAGGLRPGSPFWA